VNRVLVILQEKDGENEDGVYHKEEKHHFVPQGLKVPA
jgi:hypothetical protein